MFELQLGTKESRKRRKGHKDKVVQRNSRSWGGKGHIV